LRERKEEEWIKLAGLPTVAHALVGKRERRAEVGWSASARFACYGATTFAWLAEPKLTLRGSARERRLAEREGFEPDMVL
jgi:hypothetical protein